MEKDAFSIFKLFKNLITSSCVEWTSQSSLITTPSFYLRRLVIETVILTPHCFKGSALGAVYVTIPLCDQA